MSSSAADDDLAQEILDAYARLFVENYCIIASSGLLFVDTLFTFTDEVQRIWRRRFTGATLIFLLTRWVAVAERIVLVVSVVLPTVQDKAFDDTLTDISYLMFGVFMMLRVRGVWGGAWAPLVFLALLTPVRTIISIYTQTHYDPIAFGGPIYGCGATLGIKRESTRLGIHTPYVTLLLRDGTLYFLIILFIQTFGIISIAVGSDFVLFAVWPYFDQVFTVIFLTRFMLNLRGVYLSDPSDVHGTPLPNTTDRTATISGMRFSSSIVGNMGAPLNSSLFSDSYGSSTLSAHESDRSTDMEGWRVEDETLETSENPLFAGLGKGDEQGVEMLQTRTQE
ncbi:hypothetical protein L227DRAFT_615798 [Lentinus tigrinus ALCF2SS1-6]|uniref:DUF6533 domain-containing protein n=1 Tax=Lentinus tigrinus ALCF2SS1-6 TaxID=1328759 RepID=A0A5C2RUU0_9APHY|nr:hypothetical protein L227DRAFT_615798 [Lentinus tigrinus ALCF2SS1-6]